MGLLERIKSLVKANLNEILRRAEDPEQALARLIETMEADLAEARAGVATAVRDERKLHDNCDYHCRQAKAMLDRATVAVKQGNDELARQALLRRRRHRELAAAIKGQWEIERQTLAELRTNLERLEAKIEQARRKRETLLARRRLAKVRRELQETSGGTRSVVAEAAFDRLQHRVDDLEAEAAAYAEVAARDVTAQIEELEGESAETEQAIEAELEGIKRRLKKAKCTGVQGKQDGQDRHDG